MTEPLAWVLYDGACGFCSRWVPFWKGTLAKRGIGIASLQEPWIVERLEAKGVATANLLDDLRILVAGSGDVIPGADAYRWAFRRIWWATPLECQSAVQRRHRESPLSPSTLAQVTERLRAIVELADTVAPTDELRRRAARLVAVHPLRAADALQLAAALIWCEEQPHNEVFVSLDGRLRDAARSEGFDVRP